VIWLDIVVRGPLVGRLRVTHGVL